MSTISDGTTTITPRLVLGYETSRAGQTVFHDVIGKASPDASLAPLASRAGTLQLFFEDETSAAACVALHAGPATFTYTDSDHPTASMRYAVSEAGLSVLLDPDTRRRWIVKVGYREVTS